MEVAKNINLKLTYDEAAWMHVYAEKAAQEEKLDDLRELLISICKKLERCLDEY
jgi:hypothetical protein